MGFLWKKHKHKCRMKIIYINIAVDIEVINK